MNELIIISILIVLVSLHLSDAFDGFTLPKINRNVSNNETVEFLTGGATKAKNYSRGPENHQYFGFNVKSTPTIDSPEFEYKFPIIGKHTAVYKTKLAKEETLLAINAYGADDKILLKRGEMYYVNPNMSEDERNNKMNIDGFYYHSLQDWGINYQHIIDHSKTLTISIARFIEKKLLQLNMDNYFNRVQATTNFVQHISYGLPNFDAPGNCYFGVAIPHESFFMNYSDCDSKSIFFAGILSHLLPPQSTLLIRCVVSSNQENNSGNHMMVAVKGTAKNGESVSYQGENYIMIETTAPSKIGARNWDSIEINELILVN